MSEWMLPLGFVIVGMLVIFKSAEKTAESAILLARLLRISELAIGFILLSISTSLPELVISVSAAFRGGTDLSVGNVFGANISDVTLVLGAAAMLGVVTIKRKDLKELVMILLATSLISLLFVIYQPNRIGGVLLLLLFLGYIYWLLAKQKQNGSSLRRKYPKEIVKPVLTFIISVAILIVSAQIVVENALQLSRIVGLAETVIGGTLIALGTTLPELSVSITAAVKRHEKMAVGNAVGSSITNLSLIFGSALMINPHISFAPAVKLIVFSVIANIVLLYLILIKGEISKRDGLLLVLGYIAFIIIYAAGNI